MGIGKRIKEAREAKNLTQTELAALVGVTGSAITNYENETSHPREKILYNLINALDVDANYLFQDCIDIEKAPAPDESEVEATAARLYSALVSAGLVAEGEDITDEQFKALDIVLSLLSLFFSK